MPRKSKERLSPEPTRDMDDLKKLSPGMREVFDTVGGIEGIERALKSGNPHLEHGASIVMAEILRDLARR